MNKLKKGLAEKMFKELGYKKHVQYDEKGSMCYIEYIKNSFNIIIFYRGHLDRTFEKTSDLGYERTDSVTINEYKAITQQLRELEWIRF